MAHLRARASTSKPARGDARTALDARTPFPARTVGHLSTTVSPTTTRCVPRAREARVLLATTFLAAGFIGGDDLPGARDRSGIRPLTWDQVREMARRRRRVRRAHHEPPLLTRAAARRAAAGDRAVARRRRDVRRARRHLHYPRGPSTARRRRTRDAGFAIACTTLPGPCPRTPTLPSAGPSSRATTPLHDFVRKLDGSFDLLHAARQRLGGARAVHG